MDFVANRDSQVKEMLSAIGIDRVEDLFQAIPDKLRLLRPEHDDGFSEFEGIRHMEFLAAKNTFPQLDNYLGAGAYEHHIPAIVGAICSKSEFLTAYTPYQPEASQGMLQTIFEFQSCVCKLTGMDAANASVYDGASACAEALLMALRHHKNRTKILLAQTVHPHYRSVIHNYLNSYDVEIIEIPFLQEGTLDQNFLTSHLNETTAAVLLQSPNFLGVIEETKTIFQAAQKAGALTILSANPLVYGLFHSAAEQGADIAVGDMQPFGIPLQFGGPYVGYMACRKELVRQLPGRIVGETVDTKGRRGFVLTLQAREQHIRREKATSNICTNQALAALASLVAMLWYGKEGVRELALANHQRAIYLQKGLQESILGKTPIFNEFVIRFDQPLDQVIQKFRDEGIEPGIPLERYYPDLKNSLLVAVTETKNKKQLDRYLDIAKN